MKQIALLAGLALVLAAPTWVNAQSYAPQKYDHVEIGVYGSYLRFTPPGSTINFVGVGGHLDINANRWVALEAQMDYDFARNYTTTSSSNSGGGISTSFVKTGLRPLTGLFGPKFEVGAGHAVTAYVTGQVGFIDFTTSNPNNVSSTDFANAVDSIGGSGTHFAAYPGAGLEFFGGPIGLRISAGDELYLANGMHNNLRATIGPTIRF
ncbi:MAG: hypothetical protein WCA44_18555 [Acidobacteriaceae bacterium]